MKADGGGDIAMLSSIDATRLRGAAGLSREVTRLHQFRQQDRRDVPVITQMTEEIRQSMRRSACIWHHDDKRAHKRLRLILCRLGRFFKETIADLTQATSAAKKIGQQLRGNFFHCAVRGRFNSRSDESRNP
jgi:hypothetical protein